MKKSIAMLWIGMMLALSCDDMGTGGVLVLEGIQVRITKTHLQMTNTTVEPAYFLAVERGMAAVTNWIALCNPDAVVPPKEIEEIQYSHVMGYYPGCEVLLYWWDCVERPEGPMRADRIRVMEIKTP